MVGYSLSRKASKDIDAIYEYGIITFGYHQARNYIVKLEKVFTFLSKNQITSRKSTLKIPNLFQYQYKAHTIFYYKEDKKIQILRILGSRMDFDRHL